MWGTTLPLRDKREVLDGQGVMLSSKGGQLGAYVEGPQSSQWIKKWDHIVNKMKEEIRNLRN